MKRKLLIGCTGSVAAIKIPEIVEIFKNHQDTLINCAVTFDWIVPEGTIQSNITEQFMKNKILWSEKLLQFIVKVSQIEVKVVCTSNALRFFDASSLDVPVLTDQDEWQAWKNRGDPVLHIELRKWADVLVIAPLDANTLAKIANGLCDNLLTCIVRAWDVKKPMFFAPAMNTLMWEQPITSRQIEQLKECHYREIPCIEKTLMCGDTGMGAMATVSTITGRVLEELDVSSDSAASNIS